MFYLLLGFCFSITRQPYVYVCQITTPTLTASKPTYLTYSLAGLLSLAIFLCCKQEPFFWDTIQLGAMHGDWFYKSNFNTWLLPDRIDSGHIPAFGWYLALWWQCFGQSLWVSHLAMLPWIALVIIQATKLLEQLKAGNHFLSVWLGLLLLLADPVLLSQLTLISPDIILVAAFLLAVNSILAKKTKLLAVAVLILGLVSLRGAMVAIALFIWQMSERFIQKKQVSIKQLFQLLLPYLLGAVFVLLYLAYHYWSKGWIGVHEDSPWAASFASVGLKGFVKQTVVLVWRMLDFGRVFVWLALAFGSYLLYRSKATEKASLAPVFSFARLALILALVLGIPAIISAGLSQHRYFLPFFIILSICLWQVLLLLDVKKWGKALFVLTSLGLLTGNLWIYPSHIAQGWDASLAHKAYFSCKTAALNFLEKENIAFNQVGTVFPEVGPMHYRYLNGDQAAFQPADLNTQNYILYSNVMNDFSDEAIEELHTEWNTIFSISKRGVELVLFQKKPKN